MDNPLLPKRVSNESMEDWRAPCAVSRRPAHDPLVYAQEYTAEFVDWSGVAFFSREKLLVDNRPVPLPTRCDAVFAVIDIASKTGTDHDATAVTFFGYDTIGKISLFVLDWDVVQIEGALLETWLPSVYKGLEELARLCSARSGSLGAFIEDKTRGQCSCSKHGGGKCPRVRSTRTSPRWARTSARFRYTDRAFDKTVVYKRNSRNHLVDQVESSRIGDRGSDREDELLDTFCYGIALAFGNSEGF
jgi:hypothetical protein